MTDPAAQPVDSTRDRLRRVVAHPVVTIVVGFALFVIAVPAVMFGLLIPVFVALQGHELPPPPAIGGTFPTDEQAAYAYALLVAAIITAPAAVWLYRTVLVRGCERRSDQIPELAWSPRAAQWVAAGLGLSLAVLIATIAAVAIGGSVTWSTATAAVAPGLAFAVGLSVFAGVVEELFARGVLLRITEQHIGTTLALTISAAIFGLQHADNPDATILSTIAVAAEGGVMLGAVYCLSRTLWAPMAVHFAWNFGQAVLGLPVSGNQTLGSVEVGLAGPLWLTGGSFGVEASWVALGLWLTITAVLLVAVVRTGRWQTWARARSAVGAGRGTSPLVAPGRAPADASEVAS